SKIVMDYDNEFAGAIRHAQNVYMPFHFERSELIKSDRVIAWNPQLFGELEAAIDKEARRNGIASVTREIVEQVLTGKKTRSDETGEEIVIDKELAHKASQEQFRFLRGL